MCEILFVARSRRSDDPYTDVKCYKRGDAIHIAPDGWPWGSIELTNPGWRIVALPNVTESQAESFLTPEPAVDPQNPSRMLQRRAFKLDISNVTIPLAIRTWFQDDDRVQPIRTINMTPSQFLALRVQKDPVPDPNVL